MQFTFISEHIKPRSDKTSVVVFAVAVQTLVWYPTVCRMITITQVVSVFMSFVFKVQPRIR